MGSATIECYAAARHHKFARGSIFSVADDGEFPLVVFGLGGGEHHPRVKVLVSCDIGGQRGGLRGQGKGSVSTQRCAGDGEVLEAAISKRQRLLWLLSDIGRAVDEARSIRAQLCLRRQVVVVASDRRLPTRCKNRKNGSAAADTQSQHLFHRGILLLGARERVKILQEMLVVAFLFVGCGGVREEFVGARLQDECTGVWNVCDTTVGCLLADRSFVEGRFPGSTKVAVRLFEPSQVTLSVLLFELAGAGEETAFNFSELSCGARTRLPVAGRALVAENEKAGWVSRSADLTGVGDHLLELESDARARYLLKVDVLPLRLRE